MNRKATLSLVFGLLMAFTFTINSLMNGELETAGGMQRTLIAIVAAGTVSGGLLYIFIKDSQVDKIWGKRKED
jgi:hypothetical protein